MDAISTPNPNRKHDFTKPSSKNQQKVVEVSDNESDSSDDASLLKKIKIEKTTEEINKPKVRRTCCACHRTSLNSSENKFSRVPYTNIRKLTKNASDSVKKSFYKRKNRRKHYLGNLGLTILDGKDLRICDCHPHLLTDLTYTWFNDKGEQKTEKDEFRIPVVLVEKKSNNSTENEANNTSDDQRTSEYNNINISENESDNTTEKEKNSSENESNNNNDQQKEMVNELTQHSGDSVVLRRRKSEHPSANRRQCNFCKCENSADKGARFRNIPKQTKLLGDSNLDRMTYTVKRLHRKFFLRRSGLKANDKRRDLRICHLHKIVKIKKKLSGKIKKQTSNM
jgi:hypothetical protein